MGVNKQTNIPHLCMVLHRDTPDRPYRWRGVRFPHDLGQCHHRMHRREVSESGVNPIPRLCNNTRIVDTPVDPPPPRLNLSEHPFLRPCFNRCYTPEYFEMLSRPGTGGDKNCTDAAEVLQQCLQQPILTNKLPTWTKDLSYAAVCALVLFNPLKT